MLSLCLGLKISSNRFSRLFIFFFCSSGMLQTWSLCIVIVVCVYAIFFLLYFLHNHHPPFFPKPSKADISDSVLKFCNFIPLCYFVCLLVIAFLWAWWLGNINLWLYLNIFSLSHETSYLYHSSLANCPIFFFTTCTIKTFPFNLFLLISVSHKSEKRWLLIHFVVIGSRNGNNHAITKYLYIHSFVVHLTVRQVVMVIGENEGKNYQLFCTVNYVTLKDRVSVHSFTSRANHSLNTPSSFSKQRR